MADQPQTDVDYDDQMIADRLVEMAQRVHMADRFAVGAIATWRVAVDGKRVIVRVEVDHG